MFEKLFENEIGFEVKSWPIISFIWQGAILSY
jgi:hypothetical protein